MPFDHFNFIAGFYDKAGKFIINDPLDRLLSLAPDCLLLDAGGGTGRVAAVLQSSVREVIVADTSTGMLKQAKAKGLPSVYTPVEMLPFRSGSFNRIIMMDALHHVRDQRQTVRDLWRTLAPGGRIVIVEPDINKTSVKAIAIGEKVLLMRSHFLSGEEIRPLFSDLGALIRIFYERSNVFFVAEKNQVMSDRDC